LGQVSAGAGRGIEAELIAERDRVNEEVVEILDARRQTHGAFSLQAALAQRLKLVLRQSANFDDMTEGQRQALEAICDKQARILSGDADHADHWLDIAGYATLGRLSPQTGSWSAP
jgi:hypothetical protein